MLKLKVLDEDREVVLRFEHSLHSLSKWEQRNKKSFMGSPAKTASEMIDYVQDMLLNEDEDTEIVYRLSPEQLDNLTKYINDPATASSVPSEGNKRPSPETVTSELVYYWMTALKINWDAQYWHFNRLMMLISITNFKQQPEKKQKTAQLLQSFREMNERNKKRFGTQG